MAQLSRAQLTAQLKQATESLRKQKAELANANKFIEGLQEALRNQGVSPEEIAVVGDIQTVIAENDKMIADLFTEHTPPAPLLAGQKA